jgi:hypothetical protein
LLLNPRKPVVPLIETHFSVPPLRNRISLGDRLANDEWNLRIARVFARKRTKVHPLLTPSWTLFFTDFNVEQDITEDLRSFIRVGWSDGKKQTWQYTEADETVAFGGDLMGTWWHRPRDKFGVAFVVNGWVATIANIWR